MAPARGVVSVTLLEVADGVDEPASYLPRDPEGKVASDYVLFTPRTTRPDPCERMRQQPKSKAQ